LKLEKYQLDIDKLVSGMDKQTGISKDKNMHIGATLLIN